MSLKIIQNIPLTKTLTFRTGIPFSDEDGVCVEMYPYEEYESGLASYLAVIVPKNFENYKYPSNYIIPDGYAVTLKYYKNEYLAPLNSNDIIKCESDSLGIVYYELVSYSAIRYFEVTKIKS